MMSHSVSNNVRNLELQLSVFLLQSVSFKTGKTVYHACCMVPKMLNKEFWDHLALFPKLKGETVLNSSIFISRLYCLCKFYLRLRLPQVVPLHRSKNSV